MIKKHINIILLIMLGFFAQGCATDLNDDVYSSDSTLSLTLKGQIVSVRSVTIKENTKKSDNKTGAVAGGLTGGVVGSTIGKGSGNKLATVGGALAGAALGAVIEDKLGTSKGFEYIIKVDTADLKQADYHGSESMRKAVSSATTNGLITVVQSGKPISEGEMVYIIFSENRTRVIQMR